MANIITTLSLEMSDNWYVSKKLNSVGRVGENTVTKLIIEPKEILDNVTYEIEMADASGSKNVAELTIDGTELYLILTANMLTTSGIMKMQVRGLFTDGSIKKSNIFELKVNRSISATEHYEEYAVTIFDQLVQDCRDIIEGAESYAIRAETAAVNAEAYEQSASASAEAASASASNAATSAANAATSETNASASASNAATSETNAASSAASASTSAANANTSATNAANSATSAATSAANAHNSEVNASTSETNASTSATEAAASAESIAASVAQINENTYRINDLEAIIAGCQLTDLPTGAVASVTDGTALLMPSLKVGIEPAQEGSGDPSPDNIRPISGWTAANVTRTGKNLFGGLDMANAIHDISYNSIINTVDGTVSFTRCMQGDDGLNTRPFFKVLFDDIVTIIITYKNNGNNNSLVFLYSDGTIGQISLINTNGEKRTYVQTSYPDKPIIAVGLSYYTANYTYIYYEESGIFKGVITNADYEPYNRHTYTIQFKDGDNPLTVYGGTLDAVSGELVIDRVMADLGTLTWGNLDNFNGIYRYRAIINNMKSKEARTMDIVCSCYKTIIGGLPYQDGTIYNVPSQNSFVIATSLYSSITDFQNSLSGQTAVYELAEPITYQLTPTQIRTLAGNNNIWADTGDIISGKYFKPLT